MNPPQAAPAPLDDLLRALSEADDTRAEAAAQQLAAHGGAALARLGPLAASAQTPADLRWWAARTLALIDLPEAEAHLIDLLSDPDPDLQACAVAGLGERHSLAAVPGLTALLADPSPYLARLAGDALIHLGQAAAVALIEALKDEASPQRRAQAARALAHLKVPEAIPALFHALEDESTLVQYWADEALDRLGLGMVYFNV